MAFQQPVKSFADLPKMMPAKIELRPDERRMESSTFKGRKPEKRNPGGYDVFVNGTLFGRFYGEPRGSHGTQYYLAQELPAGGSRRCTVEEPSTLPKGGTVRRHFSEWSDKNYLRHLKTGQKPVPLIERMTACAQRAFDCGALRDPVVIRAEEVAKAERRRTAEAEAIQKETAAFMDRAREAVDPYAAYLGATSTSDLTLRIIEAMKWAQTR